MLLKNPLGVATPEEVKIYYTKKRGLPQKMPVLFQFLSCSFCKILLYQNISSICIFERGQLPKWLIVNIKIKSPQFDFFLILIRFANKRNTFGVCNTNCEKCNFKLIPPPFTFALRLGHAKLYWSLNVASGKQNCCPKGDLINDNSPKAKQQSPPGFDFFLIIAKLKTPETFAVDALLFSNFSNHFSCAFVEKQNIKFEKLGQKLIWGGGLITSVR
eukprot:TRINITY_DN645_c2_g1_i1.p3 TRINITY_DN645_c2_g1~~TRINITY_DN645_c2_g1_i1.p3  ORF type:complete len:228 (+),score=17.13 TRINITY_DN645_c2_g1_i1:38-685(+)